MPSVLDRTGVRVWHRDREIATKPDRPDTGKVRPFSERPFEDVPRKEVMQNEVLATTPLECASRLLPSGRRDRTAKSQVLLRLV